MQIIITVIITTGILVGIFYFAMVSGSVQLNLPSMRPPASVQTDYAQQQEREARRLMRATKLAYELYSAVNFHEKGTPEHKTDLEALMRAATTTKDMAYELSMKDTTQPNLMYKTTYAAFKGMCEILEREYTDLYGPKTT